MSDVCYFLYWFCSVLLGAVWIDDVVRGYTQYDGTLTGILLTLWLSISVGSIILLCSKNIVSITRRFVGRASSLLGRHPQRRNRVHRSTTGDLSLR